MDTYTAQEIINKINRKYTNSSTTADLLDMMNEAIERLYRDIGYIDVYEFFTIKDVSIYTLDASIKFETIKSFTISLGVEEEGKKNNQIDYVAAQISDELTRPSYLKVTEDTYAIYPTPTVDDLTVRITYQSDSSNLTSVNDEVNLRGDYIKAIVYYVCAEIAENVDDIAKHNNFATGYNTELLRIKNDKYIKNGSFPITKDVSRKPIGKTRRIGLGRRMYGTPTIPEAGRLY